MKKHIFLAAVLLAAALLAGCGGQEKKEEKSDVRTETAEPVEKETRYAPYFTAEPFQASGVVWIAGDSIASAHDDNEYEVPISGWGEYLADYMQGGEVHNEARSGRSSKSYLKEKNYRDIIKNLAYGDYLMIAFGLNDEKADMSNLYTDPQAATDAENSFTGYLKENYIEPALKAGAEPVLMSPVVRATYDEDGNLTEQTQVPYVEAIERLIAEYQEQGIQLYYIDLYQMTEEWYEEIGAQEVKELHGVDNEGKQDETHFSVEGSKQLAKKIAEEIKRQQMELAAFMK